MHAVALTEECLIDFHVARLEVHLGVDTESLLDRRRIHPSVDPLHLLVTQIAILGFIANRFKVTEAHVTEIG